MKTIEDRPVAFHYSNNLQSVEFLGFDPIEKFIDTDKGIDRCEEGYEDCDGNLLITNEEIASGYGEIAYDSYDDEYRCLHINEIGEKEAKAMLAAVAEYRYITRDNKEFPAAEETVEEAIVRQAGWGELIKR